MTIDFTVDIYFTVKIYALFPVSKDTDPEKHEKFTESTFNIFSMHKQFSCFCKENHGENEEICTDLKKKNVHKHGLHFVCFSWSSNLMEEQCQVNDLQCKILVDRLANLSFY